MVYGISDRYKVLSILVSVNRRRRKVFEGVSHSFKKKKEHFNISSNAIELFEYNKFNCVCINKKKKYAFQWRQNGEEIATCNLINQKFVEHSA